MCGGDWLGERLGGCVRDGMSSRYVESLLVSRWKADADVVLTPP